MNPFSPPPRLILFDLDDTLCDYASARALRLRLALARDHHGGTPLPETVDVERMVADSLAMHPHGADHFPELFRRHGVADPAIAEAAAAWYRANRFHGLTLFPDAISTIATLRDATNPGGGAVFRGIGVITNGPAEVQRAKVELLAIEQVVDFVVISGEFGVAKPDPRIFAEALRLAGATAAETVFIGDSIEHDMVGARAASIRAVWINRTGRAWPATEPRPEAEVTGLTPLCDLL